LFQVTQGLTRRMTKSDRIAVCIVVENLPVPLDRRVWKEACALTDAGYQVSVICPKGTGYEASWERIDGIDIYRHRSWEASGALGYLLEYSWSLLAELYLTLKVYSRTRFRVLQACNPPDTIFLIALLFRLVGVRFVFDQHDLGPELYEAKFGSRGGPIYAALRFLEARSFRLAHSCLATNDSFREIAIARGGKNPDSVFVVRNCPDLSTFDRPRPARCDKFGKAHLVAYVGFMGAQDGVELLLEAIDHLVRRLGRRDIHFLLIGDGTSLDELKAIVVNRQLSDYVTFTGRVKHSQVADYLAQSDMGVSPDPKNPMNDKLTMVKILEYMAFGLPIVLFDLEEGRRIAGSAGVYASPNDPGDFAEQIAMLLDRPDLRARMGAAGRNKVETELNWGQEKKSLIRAYEAAFQDSHAR
jgi:glycosyltransferase involved in cell wall biosynthesis